MLLQFITVPIHGSYKIKTDDKNTVITAYAVRIHTGCRPKSNPQMIGKEPYPRRGVGEVLTSLQLAVEPIGGYTTQSDVTHGQCDARYTVTFLAAKHHCPLTGTKLYCLVTVTEALGCEQLAQNCYPAMERPGVEPATSRSQVPNHHTIEPPKFQPPNTLHCYFAKYWPIFTIILLFIQSPEICNVSVIKYPTAL